MMQTISQDSLRLAKYHLQTHDPVMAQLILQAGDCSLEPHKDYYRSLVDSIIGQQLSVKAAASIKKRFRELFGGASPSPELILQKSIPELRSSGLSEAKARYVTDLAEHIVDGRLRFDAIDSQTNEEIIRALTDVKGIGEWTVHMFLMFCVGRLNVLPTGDLGIRNAVRNLYELEASATPAQITHIATTNNWHPYETIASWYLWRSLELPPNDS